MLGRGLARKVYDSNVPEGSSMGASFINYLPRFATGEKSSRGAIERVFSPYGLIEDARGALAVRS